MKIPQYLVLVAAALQLVCTSHAQLFVPLYERTIIKLMPDYGRPRVYALNQGDGFEPGTLLALDATNGAILSEITVNLNPTDMSITPAGDAIYVINTGSRTIMKVDLTRFTIAGEKRIATPYAYNARNPLHVVAGAAGKLFFNDGGWGPSVYTFDFDTATQRIVYDTGGNINHGAGGMVLNRKGNNLYIWNQYGWDGGALSTWVTRFDVPANGSLNILDTSSIYSRREPFDTPVFLDGAERWVFNKQKMLMATNVSVLVRQFPSDIYGISLDGSIAFGPSEVFNTVNGKLLSSAFFGSTVMTLSGDQKRLFRYEAITASVGIYDMASITALSGPSPVPTPADGAVVSLPVTNVSWTVVPPALAYDVYFGTNQAQVATATSDSPLHLSRVTELSQALPESLSPGWTYYWRLDTVGFSATNAGPVWSFTISTLKVNPVQINFSAIAGYNPASVSLTLTGAVPVLWSAAVPGANWLSVNPESGTSPGKLTVSFNTVALPVGLHTNSINLTVGSTVLTVPVSLAVKALNIRKMVADSQRPYLYAIQPPDFSGQSGSLLLINTTNGNVDKVLPIGTNPVDVAVSRADSKLYVASWGEPWINVVNLPRQTLLPPLNLGNDSYKINAGSPGRIIVEGFDQFPPVNIVDSVTGSLAGSLPWPQMRGDGESDSTGTIYYHCDDNVSNAHIHKYRLSNDVAAEVAASAEHPYGSRNLVLSLDDKRLFWRGYVFDADLKELGPVGGEIYACSTDGRIAFGDSQAYDSQTRQAIYRLPVSSTVSIVDGRNQRFWYFANGALASIPISTIQSPSITLQPATDTSVIGGGSVYLTVTAAGIAPLTYQWMRGDTKLPSETNSFLSLQNMQLEQDGGYRVVVGNPYGAVTSSVAQVNVMVPASIVAQPVSTSATAGRSFSLSVTPGGSAPFSYQWFFENTILVGATARTLTIGNAQSGNEGIYRVIVNSSVGSVTSAAVFVRVSPSAPVIVGQPASLVVGASSNVVFSAQAVGSQPLGYQWFFKNRHLPGATSPQLTRFNAQAPDAGEYRVVVSNALGIASSEIATLTVLPVPPYIVGQPQGTTLPAARGWTLLSWAIGTQPIAYQWQRNGTNLPGATNVELGLPRLRMSDSGSYTLIASNAVGVSTSAVAELNVFQQAIMYSVLSNQVVQAGDTVRLKADADGTPPLRYSWELNGQPVPGESSTLILSNLQPSQSGFYLVSVGNQFGSVSSVARVSVLAPSASLMAWGDDSSGQARVPAEVDDAVAVAGGNYHSLALRRDGTALGWGYNGDGQAVAPTNALRLVAIAAGGAHNLAITEKGSVIGWGRNDYGQRDVPAGVGENVLAIAAGETHSLALLVDGTVAAWGDNTLGQSSVPRGLTRVRAIAAGHNHSLALRADGTVVGWGFNLYGQATAPLTLNNAVAIAGGYLHSVALRADRTIVCWGDNTFGQTNTPAGLSNIVSIAAGDFHTFAMRADGAVFGWGDNSYSQLSIPDSAVGCQAIGSGFFHGMALVPPLRLTVQQTSAGLVVSSRGRGTLQWAPTVFGPFIDVPGYTGSYTNSGTSDPARFYRLRR